MLYVVFLWRDYDFAGLRYLWVCRQKPRVSTYSNTLVFPAYLLILQLYVIIFYYCMEYGQYNNGIRLKSLTLCNKPILCKLGDAISNAAVDFVAVDVA